MMNDTAHSFACTLNGAGGATDTSCPPEPDPSGVSWIQLYRDAPETEVEDLGLKVKPATMDWRRARQVPDATTGVVVTRTARASPTQLAGLRPEDLIVRVDDQPVRTVRSFVALIDAARRKKQGR